MKKLSQLRAIITVQARDMRTAVRSFVSEEVKAKEGLDALYAEWWDLWDRCPDSTPFQSPDWLLAWWRHFGRPELSTVSVRREGRLVGLAPFFLYTENRTNLRTLALLGSGISDYLDICVDPGEDVRAVSAAILEHLEGGHAGWDLCDLQELRPDSPILGFRLKFHRRKRVQSICPVLRLPGTVSEYYGGLEYRFRKRIRRVRNLLERAGLLKFETASETDIPEFLNDLFRLHGKRWEARDLPGVLADPAIRSFHLEAAPALFRRRLLRLCRITLDGVTVAVLYAFFAKGRLYCYLSGFEPSLDRLSPGMAIINYAIEEAILAGGYECDFLRGKEDYKYRWNVLDRYNYRLLLSREDLERDIMV